MTELSKMLEEYRAGERELPTYDELAALLVKPLPMRVFQFAEQNEQLARDAQAILDAEMRGIGFLVDGVSVHPSRVTVLRPAAAPQVVADDPMEWPIPCDVTVGAGTIKKGVSFRAVVARMSVLHGMAMKAAAPVQAQEPVAYRWPDGPGKFYYQDVADPVGDHARKTAELLYRAPVQPVAVPEALRLLSILFDSWENGTSCQESFDGASIGNAFKLSDEDFHACVKILEGTPRAAPAAQGHGKELTAAEVNLVLAVMASPGCKLSDHADCGEWERPQDLGLIEAVGSYKWKPSEKLVATVRAAIAAKVAS